MGEWLYVLATSLIKFNPGGAMDSTLIRVHREGVNLISRGDSGGPSGFLQTQPTVYMLGLSVTMLITWQSTISMPLDFRY